MGTLNYCTKIGRVPHFPANIHLTTGHFSSSYRTTCLFPHDIKPHPGFFSSQHQSVTRISFLTDQTAKRISFLTDQTAPRISFLTDQTATQISFLTNQTAPRVSFLKATNRTRNLFPYLTKLHDGSFFMHRTTGHCYTYF